MEDIIHKIKHENGNASFKEVDLLWYLIAKVDGIERNKVDKRMFIATIGGMTTILIILLGYFVQHIGGT